MGKMLLQECQKMDIAASVLDPDFECVASGLASSFTSGSFRDFQTVLDFGRKCHVVTVEIEHVNAEALHQLKKEGINVFPQPEVISLIQDKSKQKRFFAENRLPTAFFARCQGLEELRLLIAAQDISFPFVWKSTHGGYDGKGVMVLESNEDLHTLPNVPCIAEAYVSIEKELAIITARNEHGEVAYYPPVEMVFNPVSNLVEWVAQPANISPMAHEQIMDIAERVLSALKPVGLLAIELFQDKQGHILINELAPRPHNSGHLTIEANYTSQFEQHLRAILGLPLGDTGMKSPAVMLNLTGSASHSGEVKYLGLENVFRTSGASLHLYGKKQTRPDRKMGHITLCNEQIEQALNQALYLQEQIKVVSKHA